MQWLLRGPAAGAETQTAAATHVLSRLSQQHREKLASRQAGLAAVERFHCEVLTCQWHLDALETQLSMLEESTGQAASDGSAFSWDSDESDRDEAPGSCPDCEAQLVWSAYAEGPYEVGWHCCNYKTCGSDGEGKKGECRWFCADCQNDFCDKCKPQQKAAPSSTTSAERRTLALENCVTALNTQREQAIAGLRERASHYTVLGPDRGHGNQACENEELQPGMSRYLEAANVTYENIVEETRALMGAVSENDVKRLYSHFWRRRDFWKTQLEETWSAWEKSTQDLHKIGDDVANVWFDIMTCTPLCLPAKPRLSALCPKLVEGLAHIAATGFELELFELQLSERSPSNSSETDEDADSTPAQPSRCTLMTAVLEVVREAGALHKVGEALLRPDGVALSHLPVAQTAVAVAVARCDGADLVIQWLKYTGNKGQWVVWLTDCLIEATCEAAQQNDIDAVKSAVELCETLGGLRFASAVCNAGSRSPAREGKTPLQLAMSHGHVEVAELLRAQLLLGQTLSPCERPAFLCKETTNSKLVSVADHLPSPLHDAVDDIINEADIRQDCKVSENSNALLLAVL